MKRITSFPASTELSQFIDSICPDNQHVHVVSMGVYADNKYDGRFTGLFMESETTYVNIVRAFTVHNTMYYTLERWEHDNGYRCIMEHLTERQFMAYIASSGLYL